MALANRLNIRFRTFARNAQSRGRYSAEVICFTFPFAGRYSLRQQGARG